MFNTLLVDDERLARAELRRFTQSLPTDQYSGRSQHSGAGFRADAAASF